MRRNHLFGLALVMALVVLAVTAAGGNANARAKDYVVLYAEGASLSSARQAVAAIGGVIMSENTAVGVATVRSANESFLASVAGQPALRGAARNVPVGYEAPLARADKNAIERLTAAQRTPAAGKKGTKAKQGGGQAPADEPFAVLQWDMAMIHATSVGSYEKQQGDPGVRVGILDTGVDGKHPDIAPNFDAELSRNFTTDMLDIDGSPFGDPGPCEHPSCVDPVDEDDNGHGTHVAGTIGAALNGIGIGGIAPKVTLVNIRAGQDSGYFFLQPSVDALTYAGDTGIDVVNMSYFIDPWLYNCAANPADSPTQQMEQRTIVEATNRALDYANERGVTLIAASGNEHTNLDNPTSDDISPDYPAGTSYHRDVDGSCLTMPTMGNNVIGVGSVGPTTLKAYYSNWGLKDTTVTAPGGSYYDNVGTPQFATPENLTLSTYPEEAALQWGDILEPCGEPTNPFVLRVIDGGTCAYYAYYQGTSMAAPHAVGVAALIVSQFGHPDGGKKSGQLTMKPKEVEKILTRTATDHACPDPPVLDYSNIGAPASYNATCVGTTDVNSIWGDGIVDALAAVSGKK